MKNYMSGVIGKMLVAACTCAALAFTFSACGDRKMNSLREIYIPILADAAWLTSDGAFMSGVGLAEEELNTEYSVKGFKIRTAVIDDKDLYETGVELATNIAQDPSVTAVFNLQNFDVSKTTGGILADKKKLTLFPYGAYDSLFKKDNPYLFCSMPAFSDLGRTMAEYVAKKGYRRIAIYHNGTQAQEEISSAFELALLNTGIKIVDYVPSVTSENAFDGIYNRWKTLGIDCVVISQYGLNRAFEVLKMLRSRDKKIAVVGEPVFNSANVLAANKEIAEGMAVPSAMVIKGSDKLNEFNERYKKKNGKDADMWALQGYDMMRLVVDTAVRLDTNDPTKIAAALHDEKGYEGIGRHIVFTRGGALVTDIKELPILVCRDGVFK